MNRLWGILVVMAVLLGGCDSKPVWEDTRHLERPPPQPPHCPDLPELKNITLKDGTIADVRIVQFRDTKMYFPADLVESESIDGKRDANGFIDSFIVSKGTEGMRGRGTYLGKFDPDIYSKECPGVVHRLVEEDFGAWPIIEVSPSSLRGDQAPSKTLRYAEGFGRIYFTSHIEPVPSRLGTRYGSWNDIFIWESRLRVMVSGREGSIGRWQYSKSVNEFIGWLNTPPAKRNNDAIFTLKVDAE